MTTLQIIQPPRTGLPDLPSSSRLPLLRKCISSAALPGWEIPGEYADAGHAFHAFLDTGDIGVLPADLVERALAVNLDDLPTGEREIAVAYNLRTGAAKILGRLANHRGYPTDLYPPAEGWTFGTADIYEVVTDPTGRRVLLLWDIKTGMPERVEPAAVNLQLHDLAVAFCAALGIDTAIVGLCFIGWKGRIDKGDTAVLDAFALECIVAELHQLAADVREERARIARGESPRVTPGAHCLYCPARKAMSCPAWVTLIRELFADPKKTTASVTAQMAHDPDGALAKYSLIRMASEELKAQVKNFVRVRPQSLKGGKLWGEEIKEQPVWDAAVACEVVGERWGAEAARALSGEVTRTAIERVVQKKAGTGKVAPTLRAVLAEIEARNGRATKTTRKVHVHKPDR